MTMTAFKSMTADASSTVSSEVPVEVPGPQPTSAAFSEARFRGHLGSRFDFAGEEWRGSLQLRDVVARTNDARVEQFTTVFHTYGKAPAAGLYEVNHPEMGRFSLRIDGQPESDFRVADFALLRG
jgi:hypothetical protein